MAFRVHCATLCCTRCCCGVMLACGVCVGSKVLPGCCIGAAGGRSSTLVNFFNTLFYSVADVRVGFSFYLHACKYVCLFINILLRLNIFFLS